MYLENRTETEAKTGAIVKTGTKHKDLPFDAVLERITEHVWNEITSRLYKVQIKDQDKNQDKDKGQNKDEEKKNINILCKEERHWIDPKTNSVYT